MTEALYMHMLRVLGELNDVYPLDYMSDPVNCTTSQIRLE